jgi:hypothetical protein
VGVLDLLIFGQISANRPIKAHRADLWGVSAVFATTWMADYALLIRPTRLDKSGLQQNFQRCSIRDCSIGIKPYPEADHG